MQAATQNERINLSNAKALKRAREVMKVTRIQLSSRLNLSLEAIKKYESGRALIDDEKIQKYLSALDLTQTDFQKIKRGKGISRNRRKKSVVSNEHRRSYQKHITKEVRVLKVLRQMKNLTQDQASAVCGYSRPSIGHIENGRIELTLDRIQHIISNYGFDMSEFHRLMNEEVLRDEVLDKAIEKMKNLSEDKLKLVSNLLFTF
jgi:transcriptional regulator with XRE-family HTH domain